MLQPITVSTYKGKLSKEQRDEIINRYNTENISKRQLAKEYDVSHTTINDLLNSDYILDILNTDGNAFTRPWFGQLMTGPQLMAYLCQVNMWLEIYKPRIEI